MLILANFKKILEKMTIILKKVKNSLTFFELFKKKLPI